MCLTVAEAFSYDPGVAFSRERLRAGGAEEERAAGWPGPAGAAREAPHADFPAGHQGALFLQLPARPQSLGLACGPASSQGV